MNREARIRRLLGRDVAPAAIAVRLQCGFAAVRAVERALEAEAGKRGEAAASSGRGEVQDPASRPAPGPPPCLGASVVELPTAAPRRDPPWHRSGDELPRHSSAPAAGPSTPSPADLRPGMLMQSASGTPPLQPPPAPRRRRLIVAGMRVIPYWEVAERLLARRP